MELLAFAQQLFRLSPMWTWKLDLTEKGAAVILLQAPQLWPRAFSPSVSRRQQHRHGPRGPPLSLSANPNRSYYANLNTPGASSDVICLMWILSQFLNPW